MVFGIIALFALAGGILYFVKESKEMISLLPEGSGESEESSNIENTVDATQGRDVAESKTKPTREEIKKKITEEDKKNKIPEKTVMTPRNSLADSGA